MALEKITFVAWNKDCPSFGFIFYSIRQRQRFLAHNCVAFPDAYLLVDNRKMQMRIYKSALIALLNLYFPISKCLCKSWQKFDYSSKYFHYIIILHQFFLVFFFSFSQTKSENNRIVDTSDNKRQMKDTYYSPTLNNTLISDYSQIFVNAKRSTHSFDVLELHHNWFLLWKGVHYIFWGDTIQIVGIIHIIKWGILLYGDMFPAKSKIRKCYSLTKATKSGKWAKKAHEQGAKMTQFFFVQSMWVSIIAIQHE